MNNCVLKVKVITYNWRASEASETLSGLFNRESYIYYYILWYVQILFLLPIKKAEHNFAIAARTLCLRVCLRVCGDTPCFTAAVKIPLSRQHFSSRILFDRKLSESYFF